MKLVYLFLSYLLCSDAIAESNNVCPLDKFLKNTKEYRNYDLTNKESDIAKEKNNLSLLPNIFVGMGQSSSNDRSFRRIDNSNLSIGLTQPLYSGGVYKKTKKQIDINDNLNRSLLFDSKNALLIELFSDFTDLKYKREQIIFYENQLDRQNKDVARINIGINIGDVARIESDIAKLRVNKLQDQIDTLKAEEDALEEHIYIKYGIPKQEIDIIDYNTIVACKEGNYKDNILNNFELQSSLLKISNEITEATSLPSVSFSIVVAPPKSGTINDFTTKRADFGASVNVSLPMNQFFLRNTLQKQLAVDIEKLKLQYDNTIKENLYEVNVTKRKIGILNKSIETIKRSMVVEKNKIEYILSRTKQGQDSIISYYQQLDNYESIQINLKQEERTLALQKLYLYFIS